MEGRRLCLLWGVSLFCLALSQRGKDSAPLPIKCQAPENSIFKCHDKNENQLPGCVGKVLNCICKSNCLDVTITCKERQWQIQNASLNKCRANVLTNLLREFFECFGGSSQEVAATEDNQHLTCYPLNDKTYLVCPDAPRYRVGVGFTTNCTCKSNCRDVVLECKPKTRGLGGFWYSVDNVNYCDSGHDNFSLGPLSVSYDRATRTLRHSCGPGLGLRGASSNSCSVDGVVEGGRPSCLPDDDTTQNPDSSQTPSSTPPPTSLSTVMSKHEPVVKDNKESDVNVILVAGMVVLVLLVVLLLMFIWFRVYRQPTVSTSDSNVVHNPALQMAAPPNEDPEYDYPVLNPRAGTPEDQECEYPELRPRPGVQIQVDNVCYAANDMFM